MKTELSFNHSVEGIFLTQLNTLFLALTHFPLAETHHLVLQQQQNCSQTTETIQTCKTLLAQI